MPPKSKRQRSSTGNQSGPAKPAGLASAGPAGIPSGSASNVSSATKLDSLSLPPRLLRLIRLIHSPPTPLHASQATSLLASILKSSPPLLLWLSLALLAKFLHSPSPAVRASAATSLAALARVLPDSERSRFLSLPYRPSDALSLDLFASTAGSSPLAAAPLLMAGGSTACGEDAFVDAAETPEKRLERQRAVLRQRLGLQLAPSERAAMAAAASKADKLLEEEEILQEEDVAVEPKKKRAKPDIDVEPSRLAKLLKKAVEGQSAGSDKVSKDNAGSTFFEASEDLPSSSRATPIALLYSDLLTNLLSPLYTARHGSLLALSNLLRVITAVPSVDLTCRILAVLVLERFGDYGFTPAVFVNRELAAQTLAYIYRNLMVDDKANLWATLIHLVELPSSDVRHGVLLCLKYTVLFAPASAITPAFLQSLKRNLSHADDHVAAAACQTLTSLHASPSHSALASPYCHSEELAATIVTADSLSHALAAFLALLARLPLSVPPSSPLLARLLSLLTHDAAAVRGAAASVLAVAASDIVVNAAIVPVFQLLLVESGDPDVVSLWKALVPHVHAKHSRLVSEVLLSLQRKVPTSISCIVAIASLAAPLFSQFFSTTTRTALLLSLGAPRISRRCFIVWIVMYMHLPQTDERVDAFVRAAGGMNFADNLEAESEVLEAMKKSLLDSSSSESAPVDSTSSPLLSPPSSSPILTDIRISSLLSTCVFLKNGHTSLSKLTPLIRPIMTSVLNEQDLVYGQLNDLGVLKIATTVSGKAGSAVAARIAALAAARNPNARRSLRALVRDRDGTCEPGGICGCVCAVLGPCGGLFKVTEQKKLEEALAVLEAIADVLREPDVERVLETAPNVAAVSTDHPEPSMRELAAAGLTKLALYASGLTRMLPTLYDALSDLENDTRRDSAAQMLLQIVTVLGVTVKGRVCELLPVAMGLMGDPYGDIGKRSAEIFAKLVRVAPLVTADESEGSNEVIKHLIHGKPLPLVSLPNDLVEGMKEITLRNYQSEGVTWLNFLMEVNLNGILSDEMGLGKTLQSLTAVAMRHIACENGDTPVSLIVCPSTLINHWVGEVEKFFKPSVFRCIGYGGSVKERKEAMIAIEKKGSNPVNIVVTSYSVLRSDTDVLTRDRTYLCSILDEGHLLKNPNTATSKAARKIRARHKLILSGTPVQNRVQELWAAFDFLMPNFLGSEKAFQAEYGKVIGESLEEGEEKLLVGEAKAKLKQLHQQVLPFILRREKRDVLDDLPDKVVTDLVCELSHVQKRMYSSFCKRRGECKTAKDNIFKALLYLRLLCVHPALVTTTSAGNDEEDSDDEDDSLEEEGFLDSKTGLYDRLEHSGKLMALKEILCSSGIAGVGGNGELGADNDTSALYVGAELEEKDAVAKEREVRGDAEDEADAMEEMERRDKENLGKRKDGKGNKCLIFAQHKKSLDVVEECLLGPFMPTVRYLRLDGGVSSGERFKIAQRFNEDENVKILLLTTKVGGLGLNLTGANVVVFLENSWNPVEDLQAMDRAHRIGQTEKVNVYRLLVKGTIEEKIMNIQRSKVAMSDSIVTSDNSSLFAMGTERLLDLFVYDDDGGGGEGVNCGSGRDSGGILDALWEEEREEEEQYEELSVKAFVEGMKKV